MISAMNVNKVLIGGRFGRDHDLRYTAGGLAILNNSVAASRAYKDKNGQKAEETAWFDIKAWGKLAENLSTYTGKGSAIWLECHMRNERWEDKQTGQPRQKCVFIVDSFQFIEGKDATASRAEARTDGGPAPTQARGAATQPPIDPNQASGYNDEDDDGDDIPF